MAMISLNLLPVGFRFGPTDEELINHYLKSKNNGDEGGIEVIPEVDVCKCEPWDLPGKSVIQTADRVWFFFSPRNRKYPTGHRSRRSTKKGYWKSTGNDRKIKSRTVSGETVIGMKKTLVFHLGRAPNGQKTGWIMHEYRAADSVSGKETHGSNDGQVAYVLCRLFKQHEKMDPSPNCHEVEDSSSPSAPTSDAQHEVEVSETLSNQEISEPDMQEGPSLLPAAVGRQLGEIESQLVDEEESAARYPSKPEESNYDCNMASAFGDQKGEVEAEVLDEFYELQSEPIYLDQFTRLESPVCLEYVFESFPQNGQVVPQDLDDAEVSRFLDSVLNQDDFSSEGFYDQNDQAIHPISQSGDVDLLQRDHWDTASGKDSISSSAADSALRVLQNQAHGAHLDADVCEGSYNKSHSSQNLNNSSPGIPSVRPSFDNIYERGHVSQFVGDGTGSLVLQMDSATETQQYAYNIDSFEESTIKKYSPSNISELEGTGIKIRPRQPQSPAPAPSGQKDTAVRRLRLQMNHQVESVCSNEADESSSFEEHEVCSAKTEEQEHAKKHSGQHITKEEELLHQSSTDHAEIHHPDGMPLADLTQTLSEEVEKRKYRLRPRKQNDSKGNTGHPPRKEVPKFGDRHIGRIAFASLSLISSVVLVAVWHCFKL